MLLDRVWYGVTSDTAEGFYPVVAVVVVVAVVMPVASFFFWGLLFADPCAEEKRQYFNLFGAILFCRLINLDTSDEAGKFFGIAVVVPVFYWYLSLALNVAWDWYWVLFISPFFFEPSSWLLSFYIFICGLLGKPSVSNLWIKVLARDGFDVSGSVASTVQKLLFVLANLGIIVAIDRLQL